MPRSKSQPSKDTGRATKKSLPVRPQAAAKVGGGKRTVVRDAHDKYANQ